jgi:tetratricopeptide (TPR) repeat protein
VQSLLQPGRAAAAAYDRRGLRYLSKQEPDQALLDFAQALSRDGTLAAVHCHRARAFWLKGDYEQALAESQRALEQAAEDGYAYNEQGNAYQSQGKHAEALAAYDRAITLRPTDAVLRMNRAYSHAARGDFEQALADANEAVRLDPRNAFVYQRRGLLHYRRKANSLAIQDYQEALALDSEDADTHYGLGLAYHAEKRYEAAADAYLLALKYGHSHPGLVLRGLGHVAFDAGNNGAAMVFFSEAIRHNPRDAEAYFWRGAAHEERGEGGPAHQDYEQALSLNAHYARQAPLHDGRFFQVVNLTGEPLRVFLRYETLTTTKQWTWFPQRGEPVVYNLGPGDGAALAHDGWKIHGRRVRVWAVGQVSGTRWEEYKDRDLVINEAAYRARKKSTHTLRFTRR